MFRLGSAVLGTVMLVAFALANSEPVHVSYLFGPPLEIPLIFVVLTAFFGGMLMPGFVRMFLRMKRIQRSKERQALEKKRERERELEVLETGDLLER